MAHAKRGILGRVTAAFLTGLAFLAPILLTGVIFAWVLENLVHILGPSSMIGRAIAAGGHLFTSDDAYSFFAGILLVMAVITAIGWLVMTRARKFLEDKIDGWLGRIPLLGAVYRPMAQLVRGMSPDKGQMSAMSVCRITFGGGIETIGFLASPDTFDVGGGPAKLVMVPTAPVPVGGALILVPVDKVQAIPSMKVDDLARLYLTMGVSTPPQLKAGGATG